MRGLAFLMGLSFTLELAAAEILFNEDFSKVPVGRVPEKILVLGGDFSVQEDGKERFLELPGKPIELFAAMFGPSTKAAVAVEARILGKRRGRRAFPAFGLGLNGVSGFRVLVSPAKGKMELFRGEAKLRDVPFRWERDDWTHVRLEMNAVTDGWRVEARAWSQGGKAPAKPNIVWLEKQKPLAARATLWGAPYAGTPIRFDDLRVLKLD